MSLDQTSADIYQPSGENRWLKPIPFTIGGILLIGLIALFGNTIRTGFIIGSIVAAIVAIVGFLTSLRKSTERMHWLLAGGGFALLAIIFITTATPVYRLQVNQAEHSGHYQFAADGLTTLGDSPPYSKDLAQTYLDWGNHEIKNDMFQSGFDHLTYVATKFPTLVQSAQAKAALPNALLSWAQYAAGHTDPVTAGKEYIQLFTQYDGTPAAISARASASAAILAMGDTQMQAGYYPEAYASYQFIQTHFPQSSVAGQAHAQTAKDLLTWAQKLANAQRFSDASKEYQLLVTSFADTPEGQSAQQMLSQGVSVTGQMLKSDGKNPVFAYTTIRLSSSWNVASGTYTASGQQYFADTDSNGYFQFPHIPAGQYLVEWRSVQGPFDTLISGGKPTLVITVNPLQPLVLPAITTDQK